MIIYQFYFVLLWRTSVDVQKELNLLSAIVLPWRSAIFSAKININGGFCTHSDTIFNLMSNIYLESAKIFEIYRFPQRQMRCRFCSIRFKYESVMIDHEERLHKEEKMKEIKKRENIQQIVLFLKSEETNFDKFRKRECHERRFNQIDRQTVRQSSGIIQKRI